MPGVCGLSGSRLDADDGMRFSGSWFESVLKKAGPPSAVWREVEFEVVGAVGRLEEELGDVVFPEFGLEDVRPGIGMRSAGGSHLFCQEVEMGGIEPE